MPPASAKLGAGAKLGATLPLGEKAPPAPHAEKPAVAAPAEKPAAPARGVPPERRRALEDSVVTSAPKLPMDPAKTAGPRLGAKAKAAAAAPPRQAPPVGADKAAADKAAADKAVADKPAADKAAADKAAADKAVADKAPADKAAADKAAATDKTVAEKTNPGEKLVLGDTAGVPAALRPRRDHSKSPGFYSSVSPAHGATAVSAGPFASSQQKKATVVGIAPPPAEPGKPVEIPGAGALAPEAGALPPEAAELGAAAVEDGVAPPQPISTPPSVSPVAREEKEETSPGLGNARSRHDPGPIQQLSSSDLELLLAFALDLALGCASDAWFVPLRAAVGRLLAGDAALRNPALEKALTTLANDLEQPGAFNDENRQRLYGHVVAVDLALAKRMDVTGQKAIRERLILDQLLEELGQAHPMISRRLKEQGPLSLESLGRLSAENLSAKLEAPPDTAAQVASIFQGYLEARVRRGPSVALLGKSEALRERLSALEASAEAFERASEGEDSGARRQTRKQRQIDVAQLNLLLAELGEAKTLAEIERCSVQAKIERMQRWMAEQGGSAGRRAKPSSPP